MNVYLLPIAEVMSLRFGQVQLADEAPSLVACGGSCSISSKVTDGTPARQAFLFDRSSRPSVTT